METKTTELTQLKENATLLGELTLKFLQTYRETLPTKTKRVIATALMELVVLGNLTTKEPDLSIDKIVGHQEKREHRQNSHIGKTGTSPIKKFPDNNNKHGNEHKSA